MYSYFSYNTTQCFGNECKRVMLSASAEGSMHPRVPKNRPPCLLPPIGNGDSAGNSGNSTPSTHNNSADTRRSKYHTDCVARQPEHMDWFSVKDNKKNPVDARNLKPSSLATFKDIEDQESIIHYLANNSDFLENYVADNIPQEVIERWLLKKLKREFIIPCSINNSQSSKYRFSGPCWKKFLFMDIIKILRIEPNEHTVLWELAKRVAISIGVDAYRVYKLYPDHPDCIQYFLLDHNQSPYEQSVPKILVCLESQEKIQIMDVARTGNCKRLSRSDDPFRFPETPQFLLRAFEIKHVKSASHVMYQPILSKYGKTVYIIEMWRTRDRFKEADQEISSNFLVWGGVALHYCNLFLDKNRERNMSDFLLDVVKAIFEEMVSLDHLIKSILEFAQRLVNADRASLFLVDYRNSELVSTVFDLKYEEGLDMDIEKKEIRMPINRGIAGHVALSGEKMNISDAYSDYRFNREVDEATGYKTISILCMPVKVEGRVIGVVQMVNKRIGINFTNEDEAAFEIFSTFFGLALHHARLYDRIMRKEQKYRVALEVLSYHNTCKETEVKLLLADGTPLTINLDDFYINPYNFNEIEKCKSAIMMFTDLFGLSDFDLTTLTRFVLTVKKNYRSVPYHNFDHGWTVAHSMYVILKNDTMKRFNNRMRLALFVACLCHDLDHRGYTNKYMSETASPLASMYTTSTLEHHHFNITVTILQQDGHNIFSHLTSDEYKEILGLIKHCILATDLAAFFPNLEKIKRLCGDGRMEFDWESACHRELAMAILMTSADLSASAKPWEIQIKTVKVIFEEFYDQGDKERAAGRTPIPMMDRNKVEEQPSSQVGFLSQICVPCYDMLLCILPNTKPMYTMALKNLDLWRSRAEQVKRNLERKKLAEIEGNGTAKFAAIENNDDKKIKRAGVITKVDAISRTDELFTSLPKAEESRKALKTFIAEAKNKTIPWDEDEELNDETEAMGSKIWRNVSNLTWIDEEDEEELLDEDIKSPTNVEENVKTSDTD